MSNAPALGTIVYKSGFKNRVINGRMDVAQRGTSFAAVASGTYTLDRFQWQQSGAGIGTISQQADAPASNEFQNSLRYAVTTADTSIAATDIYYLRHAIEGYNVRDLIGRAFTLSFWVRSSKTGVHCLVMQNGAADRSLVSEYTVAAANTWEKKKITVPAGLITAGTWNWTTSIGLMLGWILAAGTNFQGTKDAWQSSSILATSGQVNCMDTVGNIFAVTGIQLESGTVDTSFDHRPYGTELAMCQRYYVLGTGAPAINFTASTTNVSSSVSFPVTMRVSPTFVAWSGMTVSFSNSSGMTAYSSTLSSSWNAGNSAYTASAEL